MWERWLKGIKSIIIIKRIWIQLLATSKATPLKRRLCIEAAIDVYSRTQTHHRNKLIVVFEESGFVEFI